MKKQSIWVFEWRQSVHYWWSYILFSPECKELTSMLDPLLYRWGVPPVVIRCVRWTMQSGVQQTWIKALGIANVMGVPSWSLVPQLQQIMPWSLQRSHPRKVAFDLHALLPWSMAEWTQAIYTLPHILGERCLEVRTGNSFLNFPLATQHLRHWHCHSPHWSTLCHPDSRK